MFIASIKTLSLVSQLTFNLVILEYFLLCGQCLLVTLLHFVAFSIFPGSCKGKPSLEMVRSNTGFSEQLRKTKTWIKNSSPNGKVTGSTTEQV